MTERKWIAFVLLFLIEKSNTKTSSPFSHFEILDLLSLKYHMMQKEKSENKIMTPCLSILTFCLFYFSNEIMNDTNISISVWIAWVDTSYVTRQNLRIFHFIYIAIIYHSQFLLRFDFSGWMHELNCSRWFSMIKLTNSYKIYLVNWDQTRRSNFSM